MTIDKVSQEIETKKVNIINLFKNYWFRIPEYQRSYVWGEEQLDELFDDLKYARYSNKEKEYFLGSIVLQKNVIKSSVTYDCFDILDGQQRMTTLFLLMAVLRDVSTDAKLINNVKSAIWQEEDPYTNQPEHIRIEFLIRDHVGSFVEKYIKTDGATDNSVELEEIINSNNVSLKNMARMILFIKDRFSEMSKSEISDFAIHLFNKVIVIYVASENLEDAFRLFTILNDRGIPLSHSDILKSLNIGEVENETRRKQYAIMWENIEGEFGRDEFDRFLGHIRTIILKEKPRENLLKEYEKIYKDRKLGKGKETLSIIESYRDIFAKNIWFDGFIPSQEGFKIKNLVTIMLKGLSSDWIPVYLSYINKFKQNNLLQFLQRLESKFSADWILQETPTKRLSNTYGILKAIEKANTQEDLIENKHVFLYEREDLKQRISSDVYGKNFCRYVLLKLEYILLQKDQAFSEFNRISVEHVLPQTPKEDSIWNDNFTEKDKEQWTHKLANLVLMSRIKNSQLNNKDFKDKKERYFQSSINIFPNINSVMQYESWTVDVLIKRQSDIVDILMTNFK